jgi:hypothetical protein
MSAETLANSTLIGAGAVTAIVSTRIYPDVVPERVPVPAIAITRAETEYVNTIHGGPPVASLVHLEIWCMSDSRGPAEALADVVITALGGAGFQLENRRPDYDETVLPAIYSSVLSVGYWE